MISNGDQLMTFHDHEIEDHHFTWTLLDLSVSVRSCSKKENMEAPHRSL